MRVLAGLLFASLLAGCTASAGPVSRDAGTLVVLTQADGATMNPLYAQGQQDGSVYVSLLLDGLTKLGPGFTTIPDLATSWTHSADGLHWDVTLRRGVRWSDGAPFTSKDVVFSYAIMRDPKTAFVDAVTVAPIRRVVARGPYVVHFDLTHPTALFVGAILGEDMLPEHVLGAIPANRQPYSSFGEHPVGTGPYRLAHWEHDSDVLFERNPYAWSPPKIARIDFRIIFDPQSMVDAIENGSADLIDYLAYAQEARLRREAPAIVLTRRPSIEVGVIEPNNRRRGLGDVVVRRAMLYAFDREAISRGFTGGEDTRATGIIPPALVHWYNPNVQRYPYDPARARAILDADGWKLGPDGVRRRGADRLQFEILVNQGSISVLDETLAFVADEAAVGIKVNLRLLDFPSIIARGYSGKYDLIFDVRGGGTDPAAGDTDFLSTSQPPAGSNTIGYADPVLDRILEAGNRELDPVKRRAIYDRMQVRMADQLPMLWELVEDARVAHASRLHYDPATTLPFPLMYSNVCTWELRS